MCRSIGWVSIAILLAACHPRPSYQHVSLAPNVRQQLYTYEIGPRSGIACLSVDTTPLPHYTFEGLADDAAEVGYFSDANAGNVRPRCNRDYNTEFHVLLRFDLNDLRINPPAGELYQVTLSGEERSQSDNSACELTRDSILKMVVVGRSPLHREAIPEPEIAIEIADSHPEREGSFRDYYESIGTGNTAPRIGNRPNFVYSWTTPSVSELRLRLTPERIDDYPVLLLGADNRDITRDRRCLADLTNLRLNLVFREE
ncbi:hypothetical protein [Gilvimarinus chinensis]|uniref:hypothetical protein n=1 Tax=Gilvimarinus chinensis TaxID=396005 RepID=UPI0003A7EF4D|nr:hypothetical protein [Gilvimarinus chinensis]